MLAVSLASLYLVAQRFGPVRQGESMPDYEDMVNRLIGEHCSVDALNARLQGERDALSLMDGLSGVPDRSCWRAICDAWNRECFDRAGVRREITCTRFGEGHRAALLVCAADGAECFFEWLASFRISIAHADADIAALYAGYRALGLAGTGSFLFSLLLYLHDPERYYPYRRSYALALASIMDAEATVPQAFSVGSYALYCERCNAFREAFNVLPQEVDFLLREVSREGRGCQDRR